jgi:hypothetical protein
LDLLFAERLVKRRDEALGFTACLVFPARRTMTRPTTLGRDGTTGTSKHLLLAVA